MAEMADLFPEDKIWPDQAHQQPESQQQQHG
eukprot:CAMPEP_0119101424 /NCGR_PEP_ID=MMETSP1180-20130426/475_1 /TAXON_ID=3052 ORGANISM="Chlamydomonas cf sp, Strain CCMP681" /NCGR_SAMPLE_ID=MMETSP1180 /ASSEMBLY_ACC=CAM_ASM_000741 /LENGTH=30 /DNA_ID= /DNA_START= /DNA_END= /DNA_ORIENTATION=